MSVDRRRGLRAVSAVVAFAALAGSAPSLRADGQHPDLPPIVGAAEVYAGDIYSGLALRGFDPVSYFLPDGPQPGRPGIEIIWKGTAWRFASEADRAAFARDPTVYAPRLGGYDAEAASRGLVVEADPLIFAVASGRLYLFRTEAIRAKFLSDPEIARQAEARWPDLAKGLVQP